MGSYQGLTQMNETAFRYSTKRLRIRAGLVVLILGLLVFVLGAAPGLFGLDRSPVTGFVQLAVAMVGLALICLGGYLTLNALWNGMERTIAADIGLRLVSTGYVIAVSSGMADVLGFGTHTPPDIPYFGPFQAMGVMVGESVIALGFLLMIPPAQKSEPEEPGEESQAFNEGR